MSQNWEKSQYSDTSLYDVTNLVNNIYSCDFIFLQRKCGSSCFTLAEELLPLKQKLVLPPLQTVMFALGLERIVN